MQTLLRCPCSPSVQSHASISARSLAIRLFGHTKILHSKGSAALAAAVPYPAGMATRISARDNEVLNTFAEEKKQKNK